MNDNYDFLNNYVNGNLLDKYIDRAVGKVSASNKQYYAELGEDFVSFHHELINESSYVLPVKNENALRTAYATLGIALETMAKDFNEPKIFGCEELAKYAKVTYADDKKDKVTIEIPSGYTHIGYDCFRYVQKALIDKVILPDTIIYIDNNAFRGCDNLLNIRFSECLAYIGKNAFSECKILQSADLPETLNYIDDYAFYNCEELKTCTIKNGTKVLGVSAFEGCHKLTDIELPDSLKFIQSRCFANTWNFNSITIPKGVTHIAKGAFYRSCIESVDLPEGIQYIEDRAFCNCDRLRDIELPDSLCSIGQSSFSNCDELCNIKLSENIIMIEDSAFYGCKSIEEIIIPRRTETVGKSCFSFCDGLKRVVFEGKDTEVSSSKGVSQFKLFGSLNRSAAEIVCYKDSKAHEYALEEGIRVKDIPEKCKDIETR